MKHVDKEDLELYIKLQTRYDTLREVRRICSNFELGAYLDKVPQPGAMSVGVELDKLMEETNVRINLLVKEMYD